MTVCLSFLSWPGLSERPVSAGAGRAVCCGAPLPGRQVPLPVASPAGTVQGFRNGVRKELQLLLRDTIITSDPVAGDGRMSARYTITPVSVGTSVVDRSQMVWGQGYGTKMQVPVMMFYVEGNGRRVLFDTGCPNPESAAKYHYPCVRKPGEEPAQALEAIGVHPSEIDTVVASHLHWDHCYNHELFTNARFLVQRTELQFAATPFPIFANAYEAPTTGITPPYSRTVFEVRDGDVDLDDGLVVSKSG